MFQLRVLFFLVISGLFLSSCAPTFTESKTAGNGSAESVALVSDNETPTLSDVRDRTERPTPKIQPAKTVTEGDLGAGNKIRIKMLPGFSSQPYLCSSSNSCEPVKILSATSSNVSMHNPDNGSSKEAANIIADVELSDETLEVVGKKIEDSAKGKKILIMTPDAELSELSAGGLTEPNALWTSAAKGYVTEFMAQYFTDLGYSVAIYSDEAQLVPTETAQDLVDLHEAVGQSIFIYQYNTLFQLPTKKDGSFNWTLGKTAHDLKEAYGADLGLFVYIRDSYSSGSRVAAQILAAAVFGVGIPGGQQVGFVSLVDLETGNILWYNRLISGGGDLRTFEPAFDATENLLEDIPL
ncbi:hypothetical protein GQF03_07390 [Sneathiella chungangensis]|uniref:Uncharacterized protein n=1 Tax=Sneathiella chungangensis TaxID=1418234 RepID=A0A845MFE5_9PROT|nr:hypothetical protein [Sneathiella chungangensis]MZR22150.1 hypothetical protein [Sneathiella chungangensis]